MSASAKVSEFLAYQHTTSLLLRAVALWPTRNPNLFYYYFPYFSIFASAVTSLGIIGFVSNHITKVPIIVRGLSIGTSYLSGIFKIVCIIIYRDKAIELHENLERYFWAGLISDDLKNLVLNGITLVRRLCWLLLLTVLLATIVFILTPIMGIVTQKRSSIYPPKYPLVYSGIYPWPVPSHGPIYCIHFTLEMIATLNLFCVTCGVDALFAYYVFQMIGHIRLMGYRLRQARNGKDLECAIKECILHHRVLLDCQDTMEKIFGPIVFWMMGTNAVVLCAVIFQLFQMKTIPVARGILSASYLILKLTQTYIYSWSGSELIAESDKYREAIYATNWFSDKNVMSSIIIMLNQKPLFLKAFGFSVISIEIFVMIVNTSISYFFLLQTMEQKT